MKIKRYEGHTEQEALNKVKEELGLDALILNIKKTQPHGLFAFLRKPVVEVTAAYDESAKTKEKTDEHVAPAVPAPAKAAVPVPVKSVPVKAVPKADFSSVISEAKISDALQDVRQVELQPIDDIKPAAEYKPSKDDFIASLDRHDEKLGDEKQKKIHELESKLTTTEELLKKLLNKLKIAEQSSMLAGTRKYDNSIIQIFYETLLSQGVKPNIAEKVLEDVNAIDEAEKIDIALVVRIVYNTIINIIGIPEPIELNDDKYVVFMGPTGVGKTTTIAKLVSSMVLSYNLRMGLITADTYRIAAVEQLRTYAEILGVDVSVVYDKNDMKDIVARDKGKYDVTFVDTAGRSHQNKQSLSDLSDLLTVIPKARKFLVLSLTTNFEDMLTIAQTYAQISDFDIIFTKMDETAVYGSILNLCYLTGKKVTYVTNGQNVPEDIRVARPEKIAKALLGMGGDYA